MFSAEQARARYVKKPAAQQRQTSSAVGSKATPAKPAAARSSSTGGKGTVTAKHGSAPAKHQAKKQRQFTPDGAVALCTARAFAETLRLAGRGAVSDSAVLDVYWATAQSADDGASITATAAAIAAEGLGGHYAATRPVNLYQPGALLILGLDLPSARPHAVAVGPDGTWWSWGEPWQPPADVVVDEAWAVSWS